MRKHVTHISGALLVAAFAVACSGRTSTVNNDRRDQAGGNRGVNQKIALRGCVQPAVEGDGYALRHVVVVPSTEQPQGQDTMEHPLIARGSSVQLAAGGSMTDDIKSYLNNEVTISGDIVEPGAGSVGTAGHDQALPGTDAAAVKVPLKIAVEKVKKIADNCAGE